MASTQRSLEMGTSFICLCGLRGFAWRQEDEVEAPRGPCQFADRRIEGAGMFELEGCLNLA